MAAGMTFCPCTTISACGFGMNRHLLPNRRLPAADLLTLLLSSVNRGIERHALLPAIRNWRSVASFAMRCGRNDAVGEQEGTSDSEISSAIRVEEKLARKRSERTIYLVAAMMSSFGITSMAIAAVYLRFSWQMENGEVPLTEMFGTFALSIGATVGMEFWARWAHRALWHDSLWSMHESHHRPREGPFELNDVFAIINAVPAIALMSYGFFNKGLLPGLCFGAGLGITVYGMAYMFVHDGLVHRRFPVGPIAQLPHLRRVAAAHQIHHADTFGGVPFGLFLGPDELEEIGGTEALEKEIRRRTKVTETANN